MIVATTLNPGNSEGLLDEEKEEKEENGEYLHSHVHRDRVLSR